VGSAPNASASAAVSHPVKQGLVQVLSVFIDTLLVCTATAFMCMCSGIEPTTELSGAPYVQASIEQALGGIGPIFITVAMILFAFTTLIGNLFYVDKAICFIMKKVPGKTFKYVYYVIASLVILLGAGLNADLLWNIADITMGGMTLINIPVIIILSKYALRAMDDYQKQKKQGLDPVFHSKDIGITEELDYWK
jgi:AGCS family alanine or glycine:cation symporter